MNRFKSYTFWVSLSSAVIILAQSVASLFGFTFETSLIENSIMAVCGVLVVLGIVKKPKLTSLEAIEKENDCVKTEDVIHENNPDVLNTELTHNSMEKQLIKSIDVDTTITNDEIIRLGDNCTDKILNETNSLNQLINNKLDENVVVKRRHLPEEENVKETTQVSDTKVTDEVDNKQVGEKVDSECNPKSAEIFGEIVNENGVQYVKIRYEFLQNIYSNNENN